MSRRCGILLLLSILLLPRALAVDPQAGDTQVLPIVDGSASLPGGQPWIVALLRDDEARPLPSRHFCGGTLIASTWVVTAAHCVDGVEPNSFQVIVGREQLGGTDGEVLAPAELIVHPFYDPDTLLNDIALIRLAAPATAQPLRRATGSDDAALGTAVATVYGWGFQSYRDNYDCDLNFIDPGGSFTDYWCETKVYSYGAKGADLEEGSLRLASYAECDARFRAYLISRGAPQPLPAEPYFSAEATPQLLCAWDQAEVQVPCFGDSGGPLVGVANGSPVLLGVVSFAYVGECAAQGQLGIFSRMSAHAAFIDDVLGRDPTLGFGALCPRQPQLAIGFRPLIADVSRVTVTWATDTAAIGWRLYYSATDTPGAAPGVIELPSTARDYEVNLRAGQQFYVALQARGAACDSALSELRRMTVP